MKRDSESIEGVALMLVWVPGEARAKIGSPLAMANVPKSES